MANNLTIHHVTSIEVRAWCVDDPTPAVELVIRDKDGGKIEVTLHAAERSTWADVCLDKDGKRPTNLFAGNALLQALEHAIAERRAIIEERK